MPFTGFDVYEPGGGNTFDPVGNSLNWSDYFARSPGGRFPGDDYMALEYRAARDPGPGRDPASPNPDFTVPEWLKNSKVGFIFRQIERDQRAGGLGPISNPLEAGPAYFPWSGEGARYGPEGGQLHGVLDQGGDRLQDRDYGPDRTPPPGDPVRPRGGGGGQDFGSLSFQPYGGAPFQSSFVDWQPIQPFTVSREPTRFVPGAAGIPRAPVAPPAPRPPAGGGGGGRGGRGGAGGGAGARPGGTPLPPSTGPAPPVPAGGERRKDGRIIDAKGETIYVPPKGGATKGGPSSPADLINLLFPPGSRAQHAGAAFREGGSRGYDVGFLDRGSPGWMRDPTTGILNTAGFPSPTLPGRRTGESLDEYATRMHDAGFGIEDILGVTSGWDRGPEWGTGPVVRDDEGNAMFQNQERVWEPGQSEFSLFGPSASGGPDSFFGLDRAPGFMGPMTEWERRQQEAADREQQLGQRSPEMANFLRGGGGGGGDVVSGMFGFGGTNLY